MSEYYVSEYYVAWAEADNLDYLKENFDPLWYRVWRSNLRGRDEAVTEAMTWEEAHEMMRRIQLLDKPAQKELEL